MNYFKAMEETLILGIPYLSAREHREISRFIELAKEEAPELNPVGEAYYVWSLGWVQGTVYAYSKGAVSMGDMAEINNSNKK